MKKRLWILHSWMGLISGLALLLVGLSGSLLVFHTELEALFSPPRHRAEISSGTPRLSLDELFARVRAQLPDDEIVGWETGEDPGDLDDVNLQPRSARESSTRWILADPYTGVAYSDIDTFGRKLVDWLYDLHISLFLSDWGTALNGIFAAVLCLLGVTGVWLYREFWCHFIRLRWRASARIFLSDLHKSIGISTVAFNLILGFTGAWWNLQAFPAALGLSKEPQSPGILRARHYNPALTPDSLVAAARRAMPELQTDRVLIQFPPYNEEGITILGKLPTKNPFRNQFGGRVSLNRETGALEKSSDIRQEPIWTQIEDTFIPLHFGTFGGLPIKILWCLGGLAPGALGISGFLIWRSRRKSRERAIPDL